MADWKVLGGGVAGCVAAMELAKQGHKVTLFEKEHQLGGFFKNTVIDGLVFDIGTILLYSNNPLLSTFSGLLGQLVPVTAVAESIRIAGSVDRYPMTLRGYARDFGMAETAAALADVAFSKIRFMGRETLDEYVRYYIGKRFYEKGGLRNYMERLYQIPVNEIDMEFSRQRLSYLSAMAGLRHQFRKRMRKKKAPGQCFARPKSGFAVMFSTIRRQLESCGVDVRLGHPAEAWDLEGKVVSTLTIRSTCNWLGVPFEAKAESIRLLTFFYKHQGPMGFSSPVIFNYSPSGRWKRVTVFSRFYGAEDGFEYFAVECTMRPGEADMDALRSDFEHHAKALGLFLGDLRFMGKQVTEGAYPVYRKSEIGKIREALILVHEKGVGLIGRGATHDYSSSHDVAKRAVEWAKLQLPEALPA